MPVILSIETSTDVCSVALHDGSELLVQEEIHEPQAHAAQLAPLIDQVCRHAGIATTRLSAVAVAQGPGSYTGLRIGVSTAKGMCFALNIPLIAVGTLELLAFQGNLLNAGQALVCPMIDARRMEVYCLVADPELRIIQPVSAQVIDETSFAELLLHERVLFFGNGSDKCRQVITHPNAGFIAGVYPSAGSLGVLAQQKFQAGEFEDLMEFRPLYLKEFIVKRPGTKA